MKKVMVLLILLFIGIKLWSEPVGLANCMNTYMLNAFIQLAYQIDPLVDILSKPQDVYKEYTLGYAFQHLIRDIRKAQKDNIKSIECEFQGKSTNLKKFTHLVYTHMHFNRGSIGSLYRAFIEIMIELGRSSSKELDSILNVFVEGTGTENNPGDPITTKKYLRSPLFQLEQTGNIENDIRTLFNPEKNPSNLWWELRFISIPKFLVFHSDSDDEPTNFPDELDLTQYIKEHLQAVYQLRTITTYTRVGEAGIYRAIVRDRDGKLYWCGNNFIRQISSWQAEGLGSPPHITNLFLYVLKTSTSAADDLKDTLTKLEQSLNNLKRVLTNISFF